MDAMVGFSQLRAIETRRAVVRCTNTGISCLVAPDGSVTSVLEAGGRRSEIEGVFLCRPPMGSATTVYLAVGDAPFWGLGVAAHLLAQWPFVPRPRLRGPSARPEVPQPVAAGRLP
jgi:apolipoprotein N-acyltransferase